MTINEELKLLREKTEALERRNKRLEDQVIIKSNKIYKLRKQLLTESQEVSNGRLQ